MGTLNTAYLRLSLWLTQLERACLNDFIKLHLRDELLINHGHQLLSQPNPAVVGGRDLPKFELIGGDEPPVSLRTRERPHRNDLFSNGGICACHDRRVVVIVASLTSQLHDLSYWRIVFHAVQPLEENMTIKMCLESCNV